MNENEIGIGELKRPGDLVPGAFQHDQSSASPMNQAKIPAVKARPLRENLCRLLAGVLNESENLERDHRQHARHQIENESADESEEKISQQATRGIPVRVDVPSTFVST